MFWFLKKKIFWFLISALILFIIDQLILICEPNSIIAKYYLKYLSQTISIISSGFFIALLIYFFTVTMQERKQHRYILEYLLKKYYDMKKDVLDEILIIINEQSIKNRSDLVCDPIIAKDFFDKGEGKKRRFRWYKLINTLSKDPTSYENINIHFIMFRKTLTLFVSSSMAVKYDITPMLSGFADSISFDHHYIQSGPEMGGCQYNPFMRSLYTMFTGFDHLNGDTKNDYFADEINKYLDAI
jgi:energy-coupling factor transporter transmembrane protein EcfT